MDTGVDWHHPDLANNIWNNTDEWIDGVDNDGNGFIDDVRGWDFVDTFIDVWQGEDGTVRDNDPMDFYGHGTHCAGIAGAVGNNSIGICGVTWNCKIMPVRAGFMDTEGTGTLEIDDAAAAIIYAADNGADIISCSWGGHYDSHTIHDAVNYAYQAGVLVVAAAGNEWTDIRTYPAAYDEVIAVAATSSSDYTTFFTNFGEWIELAAPGEDIYSTLPEASYDFASGTSMATPFVAGVAALVWSRFPQMNANQVRQQLRFTSKDLGDVDFDILFGYGRIDAKEAVELVQQESDVAVFEVRIHSPVTLGTTASIDVAVINAGTLTKYGLNMRFLVNGSQVDTETIAMLSEGEVEWVRFLWNTAQCQQGYYNLTAQVLPLNGENRTTNNSLSKTVFVRQPRTISVPWDKETIQQAIDNATEGDTIVVYTEFSVETLYLYKDGIKLIGSSTVVDGNTWLDVLRVCANNVEIRGFSFRNSKKIATRYPPFSGILLYYCNNVNISDVEVANSRVGIFVYCSNNVTLRNTHMVGNIFNFGIDGIELSNFMHDIDESNMIEEETFHYLKNKRNVTFSSMRGCVVLVNSTNVTFGNCELTENYGGITCAYSTNIEVFNSHFSKNQIGIWIRSCSLVTVQYAELLENNVGIHVENSSSITLKNNIVSGKVISGAGIWFQTSSQCKAESNSIRSSRFDFYLLYSSENNITCNGISESGSNGLCLQNSDNNVICGNQFFNHTSSVAGQGVALNISKSFGNRIYHNSFIDNTQTAVSFDSVNVFDDGYPAGGNYWSDYAGEDVYCGVFQNETGRDGIGDVPYVIDASNMDHYPLIYPCFGVKFELEKLNIVERTQRIQCVIESPLFYMFSINSSQVFIDQPIQVFPESLVFGDYNNNTVPDVLACFPMVGIADFAMTQIEDNAECFRFFRGFALRITVMVCVVLGNSASQAEEEITVVSDVSSVPN
ncbi:S8 family serine peptidase [Candidatus Bathyarchaeota archaeon]|nr:S8 family serine peptidase [Candidatus Bathyarchaeota archaeon]